MAYEGLEMGTGNLKKGGILKLTEFMYFLLK